MGYGVAVLTYDIDGPMDNESVLLAKDVHLVNRFEQKGVTHTTFGLYTLEPPYLGFVDIPILHEII